MSQASWLVAETFRGSTIILWKKLEVSEDALVGLLRPWQDEAIKTGHTITVAFETGRAVTFGWLAGCGANWRPWDSIQ